MLTVIVGAGSVEVTWRILDNIILGTVGVFTETEVTALLGSKVGVGLFQQTLAKWPIFLQL